MSLTKPNAWDRCRMRLLTRADPQGQSHQLDPGVNFFVLMLEHLGCKTEYSCEGHPGDFYIVFRGSYAIARRCQEAGFFSVEIEGRNRWSLRRHTHADYTVPVEPRDVLRWAAEAWERVFGPLPGPAAATPPTKRKRA